MIRIIIKRLYYFILSFFSIRMIIRIEFFRHFRRLPNLSNPLKLYEKIQCFKFNDDMEHYSQYVDKYEVRKFVKETISEKYLNNLLGLYDKVEDINFDTLPNRFVLKCTHGSGYNIICSDKEKLDIDGAKKQLKYWLNEDFYKISREPQYKLVKPRIVCEEYLDDKNNSLVDYKFFCFKGKPAFIQVDIDKYTKQKKNFYNTNWQLLNMKSCFKNHLYENAAVEVPRPENLDEMVLLAQKLSNKFKFVRVDFYSVNNQTVFGELTFTPASGFEPFFPDSVNYELGKLLD
ncbi:MAG: ATP-grasp fold amidoligase family protein [Bacillota bacterium]|nr:ATP-grasp fold amidoligase family protein [Bacillota bacterium]